MNTKTVKILHRWLGLTFSLCVLAAATSGIFHNIMSMTQSAPPAARPTGSSLQPERFRVTPMDAAKALPDPGVEIESISIRLIGGQPWYQFYTRNSSPAYYVSALDGKLDQAQEEHYAAEIASAFLGGKPVKKTDYLTSYNSEYIAIFRLLPVYRFDADDGKGTRVYVSTLTGTVTRATDDGKQFEADIFSNFHKYAFIPDRTFRNVALMFTTTAVALVALLGVILFWRTKG